MVTGLTLNLFDFQEKAVMKLLDLTTDSRSKQTIVVKSPTGSGKTIILIGFVDEYLNKVNSNTAVIWLCPGKGDLEEQSRQKMLKVAPHRSTQNLFDALRNGFPAESTTFINWELVTKKGNTPSRTVNAKICMTASPRRIAAAWILSLSLTRSIPIIRRRPKISLTISPRKTSSASAQPPWKTRDMSITR
jgi:hypothetical protein